MRNVDGTFNYKGLIKHMVEMELLLFYKWYKERIKIEYHIKNAVVSML